MSKFAQPCSLTESHQPRPAGQQFLHHALLEARVLSRRASRVAISASISESIGGNDYLVNSVCLHVCSIVVRRPRCE